MSFLRGTMQDVLSRMLSPWERKEIRVAVGKNVPRTLWRRVLAQDVGFKDCFY